MQYERQREEKTFKKTMEASHVTRSKYQYPSIQNEESLDETSLYGANEITVEVM